MHPLSEGFFDIFWDVIPRDENEPPLVIVTFVDRASSMATHAYLRSVVSIGLHIVELANDRLAVHLICDGIRYTVHDDFEAREDVTDFLWNVPANKPLALTTGYAPREADFILERPFVRLNGYTVQALS